MKNKDKETAKRKENIEKILAEKIKVPKEIKDKINTKVFVNIVLAVVIMVYLGALSLGMQNIPTENYIMDLKVFGIMLLARNYNIIWICIQKG